MCSEKSSEALGSPSDGRSFARPVPGERAARMPGSSHGARHISLPEPAGTMDGVADADTRDRPEPSALRIPQDPRAVEPRGLGCREVPGVSAVQRGRSGLEKTATAKEKGGSSPRRALHRDGAESGMEQIWLDLGDIPIAEFTPAEASVLPEE